MIPGQNIGVLCGDNNWLYTEVQKWDGTILVGHVINGNWAFHMNVKTGEGIIHTPWGDRTQTGWKVTYTGSFPKSVRGYNEAIGFMEEQYKRGRISLASMNALGAIRGLWWRLATVPWLRFVAACGAFKAAWTKHSEWDINTRSEVQAEEADDEDDSIPF